MDMELSEKKITITHQILKLIAELEEFKGNWVNLTILSPDKLNNLKKVATIESIGSSTRIEGVKLSNNEIQILLSGLDVKSFKNRDEEEVAGYARVMNIIFESYQQINLTENVIKQFHKELLFFSNRDIRHRGEYKKIPNQVEAFDSNGKSIGVIFKTASPFETPFKMEKLINWLNNSLTNSEMHPLIVIAVFVVSFLAIHPFQDGNGRLSRVLTTLLLLKNSYKYVPYSSLERIIEENKDNYYLFLRSAQGENSDAFEGMISWVTFFLNCLVKQKNLLTQKIKIENSLKLLSKLSANIILLLRNNGKLSLGEIVKLSGANRNTAKAHIFKLVKDGKIKKEGKGKGTYYLL
jgi:Fic family protein